MGRRYDKEVATYIPGLLEFKFQGMLEDMDTRKKLPNYPTLTRNNSAFIFCRLIIIISTLIVCMLSHEN